MLSYRHAFHAGNHADILKHTALVLALGHLKEKDKPFTVFDSHAGAGRYRLDDERLLKTGEAEKGIEQLLAAADSSLPAAMHPYISLCRTYASQGFYPGSPEIERCLMRPGDCLIISELHNTEIDVLHANMKMPVLVSGIETVKPSVHHRDGYEMLRALTPPAVKRGLALIDPSYEENSDYTTAAETLAAVHKKWPAGIIMLWYPLLARRRNETANLKRILTAAAQTGTNQADILDVQLLINTEDSHIETGLAAAEEAAVPRLYGSGIFIINPPWKLGDEMRSILPYLAQTLGTQGSWSVS